ncbi:MAG: STT3 domain-containing protein [Nanoarchaeota archaeon]|nr:STT3 domain-containing protein [Nanoarchaeota archaeon]
MDEDKKIDESEEIRLRKEKIINFFKSSSIWVILLLLIALYLGVYIRALPMKDHGNGIPGLWDSTRDTWSLGPDLDPWLFLRSAKTIVETGSLPKIDYMRNIPVGFDNSYETQLLPYMIVWTYNIIKIFEPSANIELAGVLFPVIMFAFTIISFFLFVREVFVRKDKESKIKANVIALISTFLMIVMPEFLSRTIAGIPEKESAAFFFMFLSFFLFLKSWKAEKTKTIVMWGVLSGISTAMIGLIWGGVLYVFIPIGLAGFIGFLLNKFYKKEIIAYSTWLVSSFLTLYIIAPNKYPLKEMIVSIDTGLAFFVFVLVLFYSLFLKIKLYEKNLFKNIKIPRNILSVLLVIIIVIILISITPGYGPGFIIEKIKVIHQVIFQPIIGRWNITVAENRQPYFTEWGRSFGPFIKNFPIMFWLFFAGSVLLFRKMLSSLKRKDAWIITACYVLFFFGLVFSRYAPHPNPMDGDGLLSKMFYYGSALILAGAVIYYYKEYYKKGEKGFEQSDFEYILLLSLFVLTLMTARGAIRLIMVLAPISTIFVGFLVIESIEYFRKTKDETLKVIIGALVITVIFLSIFSFWTFYQVTKNQAYGFVPSSYNFQWQKAMDWVRKETPKDAVFAHWWDYGYWLQSIGERPTILDGGNAMVYWNYLMGRLVLTGDNQEDSLEFLYNHNASYLLIDSTDIGKYGAFASIGSDEKFDRYSWIMTMLLDEKQTTETNNQTLYVYAGGVATDEEMTINESGREVYLPAQQTGVGAIVTPIEKTENSSRYGQPYAVMFYNNKRYNVNMRYLSVNGEFMDFKTGIKACAFVFPRLLPQGQGLKTDPVGAAMYLSPRLMRGYLAQKYILNDPFKEFPNFQVAHSEPAYIIDMINTQNPGANLPEFVYYEGVYGPIKIWNITYTGKEKIQQKYLDTDPTKYLSWRL